MIGRSLSSIECSGTGFTCIYPLLGCRLRTKWRFVATEIDPAAVSCAIANIARNDLAERIRVVQTSPTAPFFASTTEPDTAITAVMCNPPFYMSAEHRKAASDVKRTLHPTTPGTASEMVTDGGEVAFVQRMMRESVDAAHKIVVFSAMVGFKSSIAALRETANELGIPCFLVRSLHQGRTVRWVVAWSFSPALRDRTCRTLNVPARRELTVSQLRTILTDAGIVVAAEDDDWLEFPVQEPTWTRAYKRRKLHHGVSASNGHGAKETISLWWSLCERPSRQPEMEITAVWIAGPRGSAVFMSFMTFVINQIGK
ncbi:hypothetical protein, variant 1 [Allomyces macrogynus ATCC 38327]|uniref:Methyltransferase small domain-containing protein n=1 Tax=Allomyces macrogynus (strain ATCC 38327) TaxID=578462 RepID=A0A0L0SMC2_ALLM3|nr:hypothetical protein, variant 2 [Allomyces macrogynus ATCC 38327]KNE63529.1 hypothetical protein, variant 1 [Allomyces macrogynus ATCC 38327]|eukprot:KNE63528.1 hypothetical protein, variant 2 [Allomyces macrogynus ATCC 38327]